MEKFVRLTAKACPLLLPNLNTDQILPARYLKWPRSKGLGTVLFQDLRFDADGKVQANFPFNRSTCRDAKILLAGRNFGGGSSREAAVYAVYDHGIRCVIAPSFGDIFAQNAVKNGLLTAIMPDEEIAKIVAVLAANPEQTVSIDLEQQTISCSDQRCVHGRSGQPQSTAERLGRCRFDRKLSFRHCRIQCPRQAEPTLGEANHSASLEMSA
jgi:3-isopropylmalate/(R)-2-methylmalate dehydratase small subunit